MAHVPNMCGVDQKLLAAELAKLGTSSDKLMKSSGKKKRVSETSTPSGTSAPPSAAVSPAGPAALIKSPHGPMYVK